MTRFT